MSAEFLKHRKPQSEVKVKDLQSGDVTVVAYKPDAGRCSSHYQAAENWARDAASVFGGRLGFGVWQRRLFGAGLNRSSRRSDQPWQLDEVVGRHRQRKLEVELLHATQHRSSQATDGLAPTKRSSTACASAD